jgi:hypothetical protein
VVFHLIGALSEFGKLGVMCVANSRPGAEQLYTEAVAVLNREAREQAKVRNVLSAKRTVVDNEAVS